MTANLRRALAVGITATLAFLGLLTVPAHSAPASTPASCAGVWVAVQSDETSPNSVQIGCALSYATGLDALASAGFVSTGGALVAQIDGRPTDPNWGTNGHYYWSYWTAPVNADGTLGTWAFAVSGAATSTPAKGVAEGWRLTNTGAAGPAATKVFTPVSSSAPASGTAPSSASASPSTTISAAAASSAPTKSAEVLRAATYLSKNLPTTDDGTGTFVSAALALSAAQSCDYSAAIAVLVASIKSQAADYVGNDPVRAANLAILAIAVGDDPASFGGLNLLPLIAAGTQPGGQVGAYSSSYAQSLAVIAYVRAGQPVPAAVLANLVAGQDASGAFGYTYSGTFYPDYDTTGLAIEALSAAHGDSAVIAKAVAWALSEQTGAGYWPNPYSPVDSTGILASGLQFSGVSVGKALSWIQAQQLADGGFPASLDSTTSNVMATADAMWLLAGSNLVKVSSLRCSATNADPTVSIAAGTGAATLADTGSPEDAPFGPLAVSIVVIGAGMVVLRRRQRLAR
jgi:hypothetical protein